MVDRSVEEASLCWRKSRASNDGGDCVEVASLDNAVLVRDSRARYTGVLALDGAEWNALVSAIRNGRLDGRCVT